jgi:hypothetical protein
MNTANQFKNDLKIIKDTVNEMLVSPVVLILRTMLFSNTWLSSVVWVGIVATILSSLF